MNIETKSNLMNEMLEGNLSLVTDCFIHGFNNKARLKVQSKAKLEAKIVKLQNKLKFQK